MCCERVDDPVGLKGCRDCLLVQSIQLLSASLVGTLPLTKHLGIHLQRMEEEQESACLRLLGFATVAGFSKLLNVSSCLSAMAFLTQLRAVHCPRAAAPARQQPHSVQAPAASTGH